MRSCSRRWLGIAFIAADELAAEGIDVAAALTLLSKRKGFLNVKPRTARSATITDKGRELLASGVKGRRKVTQLTPEMLADGTWRDVELQPYDVTLAGEEAVSRQGARVSAHAGQGTAGVSGDGPLRRSSAHGWRAASGISMRCFSRRTTPRATCRTRSTWPSRDRCKLPDEPLVERIKATHENGGDTGSTGWQYRWNRELAHKPVLRTHTTAATCRALAAHTQGEPGKYFIIGPVFRRETVDYKHLPVFNQVDGIIVDRHASLATLLGTLAAFYKKMGFPKIRFRPSFFPYTEPSAEVFLWLEHRKEWVEMGGSGIFRPEVTLPVGVTDRVLAWGLGSRTPGNDDS